MNQDADMNVRFMHCVYMMTHNFIARKDAQTTENEWVRIISKDGFSYLIRRKVALGSGTLKNMLDSDSTYI